MTEVEPRQPARPRSRFLTHVYIVMAVFAGLAMLQLIAPQLFPTGAELVIKLAPSGTDWVGSGAGEAARDGGRYRYLYRPGQEFSVVFTVTNAGPLSVTLSGVDTTVGGDLTRFESVDTSQVPGAGALDSRQPLRSLSLQPGRSAILVVTERFAGCRPAAGGSSATLTLIGVKGAAAGVNRTVPIDLATPVHIEAAPDCRG